MQKDIKKFACVFPFDSKLDRYHKKFAQIKKYVDSVDDVCLIYSPNGVLIATVSDQWYMIH